MYFRLISQSYISGEEAYIVFIMHYFNKNIGDRNILWVYSLLILSLVSCNDNKDEDFPGTPVKESFYLNLDIKPSFELITKADSDGNNDAENEAGSYLEHYMDIANNDFHIAIFNESGDFVTEFKGEEVDYKKENNAQASHLLGIGFKDDDLKGFPADYKTEEFTVIILANWRSFTGRDYETFEGKNIKDDFSGNVFTDNDFYDFSYRDVSENSWQPSLGANAVSLMPMMGIGKFKGFAFSAYTGRFTAYVTVRMLRALAKITFSLNDKLWKSGFEIGYCKLNKVSSKGKLIPDLSQNENTFENDGIIDIGLPWDTKTVEKSGPISFVKIGEPGTNPAMTAYVPEMNTSDYTTSSSDRPLLMAALTLNKVKFKDDKTLEFNDNKGSSPNLFHILRNHHYKFIVEDISEEGEITLSYTVCPWDEGSVDIGFH